jgi:hypothetical protein
MKKRFIYILVTLVLIISMSLISAQPYLKQNENAQLNLPCTINGIYCSAFATCIATITNPNSIVLVNNQSMIQNNAVFSINLSANQTTLVGEYEFNVNCCDGGFCASKWLHFYVNPTGMPNDVTETYFFIFIGIVLFILILLSIYQMTKTENYGWVLGWISFAYILLIILLFILYQIATYYIYTITIIVTFMYLLWWFSMIMFVPFIFGMGMYMLYKASQEKDVKKYIDMGYTEKEAGEHAKRR